MLEMSKGPPELLKRFDFRQAERKEKLFKSVYVCRRGDFMVTGAENRDRSMMPDPLNSASSSQPTKTC
jgi:hypothetical protein